MNKIKKFFYRWFSDKPLWRVIYQDGRRTRKLDFSEANELKKIFGGKLILDTEKQIT